MVVQPEELSFEDGEEGVTVSWNDGAASIMLVGVSKDDLAQEDFMFTEEKVLIPIAATNTDSDSVFRLASQPSRAALAASSNDVTVNGGDWRFGDFHVRTGGEHRQYVF